MNPGPGRGASAAMTVVVEPSMAATFSDEEVHPVYGTAALVQHIEQVSRNLLRPHLEREEEGVGARVDVRHVAPAPVGARVELVATVAAVAPQRLVTEVVARAGGRVIARATFEQAIVHLPTWRDRAGL